MKFKRSSLWTKLIVMVVVVYAAVTLVLLQSQVNGKREEAAALSRDIVSAQQEQQRLTDANENIDTDEGVEEIARNKLGMTFPGEITFQDAGK